MPRDRVGDPRVIPARAISAAPPGKNQVRRTALPDTFDGIRFEVGRMAKYVQEARGDAVVIDCARLAVSHWGRMVEEMSARAGDPVSAHNSKAIALEGIDLWCRENFCYQNDGTNVEVIQTPNRMAKMTKVPKDILKHFIEPFYKAFEQADPSFYRHSYEPPPLFVGDCVPVTQRIIVQDRTNGRYAIKEAQDVGREPERYNALSYNFERQTFELKPVAKYHDKGIKDVYRITLKNNCEVDCTLNHNLFLGRRGARAGFNGRSLDVAPLNTIMKRMSLAHKPSMYVGSEIPAVGAVNRPMDLLWIEGLFVAEGSICGSHVELSNKNPTVIKRVRDTLLANAIPFTARNRKDGGCLIRIKRSAFKDHLASAFGRGASNKHFPEAYLSLPKDHITVLVDGYSEGDAYKPRGSQWERTVRLIHNTSSGYLSSQLMAMHMLMGRPLTPWLQKRHGGSGRKPIWRLYEYLPRDKPQSRQKGTFHDVMDVCVKSIKKVGARDTCDLTVMDNHNFVTEQGAVVKQCDEAATIVCAMAAAIDITPVAFQFGGGGGTLHHVWARVFADGEWYDSDVTEPEFTLGQHSEFEHYETYEIPL